MTSVIDKPSETDAVPIGQRSLATSDDRFRLAFEDTMAPMLFTDLDNRIITVNDSFCQMVGYSRAEILGRSSQFFTHPDDIETTAELHRRMRTGEADHVRYVKRYVRKDGRTIYVEVSKSPVRDHDGSALYFIVSQRDITNERALSDQLAHQALHDPLTGLANRALFDDRLCQSHARVVRQKSLGAVLLLDLDNFSGVNSAYGYHVGDQLLALVAHRLENVTRSHDSLCRSGDDEFLCLAEGLESVEEAEQMAMRLLAALDEPFSIAGEEIEQHASIGIVLWDNSSEDYAEVVQRADVALNQAKYDGKGRYAIFTPRMHQQAVARFSLTQELRHALQHETLTMHYQPIVNLASSDVVGFEALMRWQHPERGWVAPDIFIPLAEQSDLILDLGSFALRNATQWASANRTTAGQAPYVSVNCSARQFHDANLVTAIERTLLNHGLEADRLVIEITEGVALLDIAETMRVVERLSGLGIGLALDDFGTGFSSLSYLTLLQPRFIKIDRSFVSPSRENTHNDTLLETIISLGHKLAMTVVAEGVETTAQLARLRELGCDLGQGYLFSQPAPADEAATFVGRALDI